MRSMCRSELFVMLDRLRRGDEREFQLLLVLNLAADFAQPSSRMPSMAGQSTRLGCAPCIWKHLLDALHVILGWPEMGFERGLELRRLAGR